MYEEAAAKVTLRYEGDKDDIQWAQAAGQANQLLTPSCDQAKCLLPPLLLQKRPHEQSTIGHQQLHS